MRPENDLLFTIYIILFSIEIFFSIIKRYLLLNIFFHDVFKNIIFGNLLYCKLWIHKIHDKRIVYLKKVVQLFLISIIVLFNNRNSFFKIIQLCCESFRWFLPFALWAGIAGDSFSKVTYARPNSMLSSTCHDYFISSFSGNVYYLLFSVCSWTFLFCVLKWPVPCASTKQDMAFVVESL